MHIILADRTDRLGTHILFYIAQILFAYKHNYFIKFRNNNRTEYRHHHSIFVSILFDYVEKYNNNLAEKIDPNTNNELIQTVEEYITCLTTALQHIQCDLFTYFQNHILCDIKDQVTNISNKYNHIPFDVDNTILIHLRLDDTALRNDYDGSVCSSFYREKIQNNETCSMRYFPETNNNTQCPLSKEKLEDVIRVAREKYSEHKIILLTSPRSDTSFLEYDVIKNDDESYDLYLLTMCKVVILSRSNFALSSLFFNDMSYKNHAYIPLWGHAVCLGADTVYDKMDKSKVIYFY
jgi:hypothetical protein